MGDDPHRRARAGHYRNASRLPASRRRRVRESGRQAQNLHADYGAGGTAHPVGLFRRDGPDGERVVGRHDDSFWLGSRWCSPRIDPLLRHRLRH